MCFLDGGYKMRGFILRVRYIYFSVELVCYHRGFLNFWSTHDFILYELTHDKYHALSQGIFCAVGAQLEVATHL